MNENLKTIPRFLFAAIIGISIGIFIYNQLSFILSNNIKGCDQFVVDWGYEDCPGWFLPLKAIILIFLITILPYAIYKGIKKII